LITGATGQISSNIFPHLKSSGHKLRALVHSPDKAGQLKEQGIEVQVGDLSKPWTLAPAFAGCDTVWILCPGGPRAPEQSSNALWAARQGGAQHVVRMSAVGAAHDAPTINSRLHALADEELAHSGLSHTILKPHFFAQNLLGMAGQTVASEGTIYLALGEGRLGLVDTRDISEVAAKVLANPAPHAGKTYTLTGPASVNMSQVAVAFSEALGKPIKYVPIPLEAARAGMAKWGMDDWMVNFMSDYLVAYSKNWGDLVTDDVKKITGKAPHSIAEFVRDFAGAFGKK
jgi:uncharacterized protein YbjT (DUF2867 family)